MKQETPAALRFLSDALGRLEALSLLRRRELANSVSGISFCSNDYLGLADRPNPPAASGASASRLVAGERPEHQEAERAAADLVGLPDALAFTSGYAANLGVLSALAGRGDLIVSDALNHASIIDGARLSRADVLVVPHVDVGAIEVALSRPRPGGRRLVVTESYFSMDADSPDLGALRRVCDTAGAVLVVDEAHALGVLGPDGRGLCREAGIEPDVLTGTFGKSFGAAGAFAAGCTDLVTWLWNRARSFVFSTGLSPAAAAAALGGMRISTTEPMRRERVLRSAERLRRGFAGLGLRILGHGHVVPWVVGDPAAAVDMARALGERGIRVRAIRPPTVPEGTARLRFTVTAAHTERDVDAAVDAVADAIRDAQRRPREREAGTGTE